MEERLRFVARLLDGERWGRDWIMLPNPSYGSWEGASFGFNWGAPDTERRQMKFDTMDDWHPAM